MRRGVLRGPERAARAALAVTFLLAVAKVLVWAATSSLAVLSQALDSVLDVVALGLLYLGIRLAHKPADETHHYGHGKAENLVAFVQTLLLVVVAVGIAGEAIARLGGRHDPVQAPWFAFVLLGLSALIDAVRVRSLLDAAKQSGSEAVAAGALNLVTDIATAVVAFTSLILVRAGIGKADAVGALIVAFLVVAGAFRLGKRSVDILMDRAPRAKVDEISAAAARAAGVAATKRVRVRGSGDHLFADVTVSAGRTASLERAHDISDAVEEEITRVAPGTDVVVHVEPVAQSGALSERVTAAASRVAGINEVHNVSVHAFDDAGRTKLHATLHAKLHGRTSLSDAHALSDAVEQAVRRELGSDARVDTHLEPLDDTEASEDVTSRQGLLVETATRLAVGEADVLDCHEVLVTSSAGELSLLLHVRGRGDLPLRRMHEASNRIEKAIHAAHPEVGRVVIHFEPR